MRASQYFSFIFKNIRAARSLKLFIVVLTFVGVAAFSASAQRKVPSPYQGEGDGVSVGWTANVTTAAVLHDLRALAT